MLVGSDFATVAELTEVGVRRISVGGALARAAWTGFLQAAKEIAEHGTFSGLSRRRSVCRDQPVLRPGERSMTARELATEATTGNVGAGPRSRGDLLIGFSFSLWPDSSPGRCNELIAKSMRADLARVSARSQPWVGVQWEIFDALADLNTTSFAAAQFVPERAIAGPSCFYRADIRDGAGLIELLRDGRFPAVRRLAESLAIALDAEPPPDALQLCAALNRILDDRWLFETFDGFVELADLDRRVERPELGFLGTEKRRLPTRGLYPNGLRKFQARRINRLLIEAIVPERILARGEVPRRRSGGPTRARDTRRQPDPVGVGVRASPPSGLVSTADAGGPS